MKKTTRAARRQKFTTELAAAMTAIANATKPAAKAAAPAGQQNG